MGKQTLQKRISKSFILAFVVLLTVTMGAAVWISARVCRVQTSRLCRSGITGRSWTIRDSWRSFLS